MLAQQIPSQKATADTSIENGIPEPPTLASFAVVLSGSHTQQLPQQLQQQPQQQPPQQHQPSKQAKALITQGSHTAAQTSQQQTHTNGGIPNAQVGQLTVQQNTTTPNPAQNPPQTEEVVEFPRFWDRVVSLTTVRHIEPREGTITSDIRRAQDQFRSFIREQEETDSLYDGLDPDNPSRLYDDRVVYLEANGKKTWFFCFTGLKDVDAAKRLHRLLWKEHRKQFHPTFKLCYEIGDIRRRTEMTELSSEEDSGEEEIQQWSMFTLCGALASRAGDKEETFFTIGGVLQIDQEFWALTCKHVGFEVDAEEAPRPHQTEKDLGEDSEEEVGEPVYVLIDGTTLDSGDPSEISTPDPQVLLYDKPPPLSAAKVLDRQSMDGLEWSLHKVIDPAQQLPNCCPVPREANASEQDDRVYLNKWAEKPKEGPVIVCCGRSGLVEAEMLAQESNLRIAAGKIVTAWRIEFINGQRSRPGDSGSWVVDTTTGTVYGHLMSVYRNTGYILPLRDIVSGIKASFAPQAAIRIPSPFDTLANASRRKQQAGLTKAASAMAEEALSVPARRASSDNATVRALRRFEVPGGRITARTRAFLNKVITFYGADFLDYESALYASYANDETAMAIIGSLFKGLKPRPHRTDNPELFRPITSLQTLTSPPTLGRDMNQDLRIIHTDPRSRFVTCVSSEEHSCCVADPFFHFTGCIEFNDRDRFLKLISPRDLHAISEQLNLMRLQIQTFRNIDNPLFDLWNHRMAENRWRGFSFKRSFADYTGMLEFMPVDDDFSTPGPPGLSVTHYYSNDLGLSYSMITAKPFSVHGHAIRAKYLPSTNVDDIIREIDYNANRDWQYVHWPVNNFQLLEASIRRLKDEAISKSERRSTHLSSSRLGSNFDHPILQARYCRANERRRGSSVSMRPFCGLAPSQASEALPSGRHDLVFFMPFLDFESGTTARYTSSLIDAMSSRSIQFQTSRHRYPENRLTETLWPLSRIRPGRALGEVLLEAARRYLMMSAFPEISNMRQDPATQKSIHRPRIIGQEESSRQFSAWYPIITLLEERKETTRPVMSHTESHNRSLSTREIKASDTVLMVSSLWLWVIDEKTVITSFPDRRGYPGRSSNIRQLVEQRMRDMSTYPGRPIWMTIVLIVLEECINNAFQWQVGRLFEGYRESVKREEAFGKKLETVVRSLAHFDSITIKATLDEAHRHSRNLGTSATQLEEAMEAIDQQKIAFTQLRENMTLWAALNKSGGMLRENIEVMQAELDCLQKVIEGHSKDLWELHQQVLRAQDELDDLCRKLRWEVEFQNSTTTVKSSHDGNLLSFYTIVVLALLIMINGIFLPFIFFSSNFQQRVWIPSSFVSAFIVYFLLTGSASLTWNFRRSLLQVIQLRSAPNGQKPGQKTERKSSLDNGTQETSQSSSWMRRRRERTSKTESNLMV